MSGAAKNISGAHFPGFIAAPSSWFRFHGSGS